MKAYLKWLLSLIFVTILIIVGTVIGILKYPGDVFHSGYQSLVQDQYRILKNTNDPKIVVVGGSSLAFGLNQQMIEEATGYEVVNLGLHAGLGLWFPTEMAKTNINEDDIVLVGYEYLWIYGFDAYDQSLIMSGIDDNIEMYRIIPLDKWPEFLGNIFEYAEIKNTYEDATGIYSREAFDSNTVQMTMERDSHLDYSVEEYGTVDISNVAISPEAKEYVKEFKDFVEERGAKIYFIAPPLLADCIVCDYAEFDKLRELEESEIGIPYISNPRDYFLSSDYFYDTVYHCNSAGEKLRTELLIEDLLGAGIVKNEF